MYILSINILVNSDDNLIIEEELEKLLENYLWHTNKAEYVSTISTTLSGDNYGKCVKFGTWPTDNSKSNSIQAFSNGAKVGDNWYCDMCYQLTILMLSNRPELFYKKRKKSV